MKWKTNIDIENDIMLTNTSCDITQIWNQTRIVKLYLNYDRKSRNEGNLCTTFYPSLLLHTEAYDFAILVVLEGTVMWPKSAGGAVNSCFEVCPIYLWILMLFHEVPSIYCCRHQKFEHKCSSHADGKEDQSPHFGCFTAISEPRWKRTGSYELGVVIVNASRWVSQSVSSLVS